MPNIVSLEVMCAKDHMDVHLTFSHPFEGIVSSKNQHSDPRCIYVPPSSGKTFFSFRISYSRCGTKPDLNGQFYENTVSWICYYKLLLLSYMFLFMISIKFFTSCSSFSPYALPIFISIPFHFFIINLQISFFHFATLYESQCCFFILIIFYNVDYSLFYTHKGCNSI